MESCPTKDTYSLNIEWLNYSKPVGDTFQQKIVMTFSESSVCQQ